ncbi:hypothetical protein KP509_05G061500 [Ceratopteris richardii]|uniref:Complex 1 LYR protein domain-containing protein n=2 Tax=Ceratopteris richardii TaxID=49495 RepID=A0A8T2UYV7_CERRI|nr:hypothetical protein KP509_05G061500 [Ceratopteris richardii]
MDPKALDNVRRLYRECLRRAEHEGRKRGNTEAIKEMIRQQFKRSMKETDIDKIQEMKKAAVNGLLNHLIVDMKGAEKQAKR